MRLFPRAGNYMVSLKDQLWIHDYDWGTRNPITPVVVKMKVRRQLSCRFFQLRSFLDKEEEVGERPCASNFVVPGWKLNSKIIYRLAGMRLFPRAGNYMVSLKDQLWIHDYDWESCNDRKCDKDQESDDDQKPHNSGCCKIESEKTIESFFST